MCRVSARHSFRGYASGTSSCLSNSRKVSPLRARSCIAKANCCRRPCLPSSSLKGIWGLLWLERRALTDMGNYNPIVFFVVLVGLCVPGGIPIAFALGTATFAYLALTTHAPLLIVVSRMDEGMSGLMLLAVPLFVLLGGLIELSGLTRSLIEFMAALLGHVRGGLQYLLLAAMFLVSVISGSKAADMAAVAPALFPEMKRHGSNPMP